MNYYYFSIAFITGLLVGVIFIYILWMRDDNTFPNNH